MTRKKLKKLKKLLDRYELEQKLVQIPWKTEYSNQAYIGKTQLIEHLLRSGKITMEEALKLMYP